MSDPSTAQQIPTLYVLYGSATGNAEQIAKDLATQQLPPGFERVLCEPMEKFKRYSDAWLAPPTATAQVKHGLILVASTTGNGDAPENASRFVRYVKRKSTAATCPFQHCAFAVLGLGDTNYDQFCATGKTLDKKVAELGGTQAKPLGMADEATGLEDVVDPWVATVFQDVTNACFETALDSRPTEANVAAASAHSKDEPDTPPPTPAAHEIPQQSSTPLCILYGSATGNAEHIAKDLAATYDLLLNNPNADTFFPSVLCCELDQWKKQCLPHWEIEAPTKHGIVIVTSTTGNGDPPENASRFVRYLKRKSTAETTPFQHCAFAVLGLGDTNYDKFGETARVVDKKLQQLGGTAAKTLVIADEATGLEEVVEPWTRSVLVDISNACRGVMATSPSSSAAPAVAAKLSTDSRDLDSEEKKMDLMDTVSPPLVPSFAPGVVIARSLLSLSESCGLPCVEHSCLPPLGTSLSSCQFICDEDIAERRRSRGMSLAEMDRLTMSSSSTTVINYTMAHPYESKVVNATYLTTTSKQAAGAVSDLLGDTMLDDEQLMKAMDVFAQHFPIVPSDKDDADTCQRNGKRVIEMAMALPDDFTLEYQPGDSLGIVVPNTPHAVRFVLDMLNEKHQVPPTQKISIDSDHPVSVEEAVRTRIDLCSPIKSKRILHSLSQFATDPEEETVLRLLASKTVQGDELFRKFIDEQRLTAVDVLKEFPSCQSIPLEGLFGILPGIPPRYYSVSSSPLDERHGALCLTVTFSVVDYMTPSLFLSETQQEVGLRRIGGVATRYLEVLCAPFLCQPHAMHHSKPSSPATLAIFPKPTKEFQLPASLSTPIVLIGPGTGVAPFMGFLRHRQAQALRSKKVASTVVEGTWRGDYELQENELPGDASGLGFGSHSPTLGKAKLFFGCRYADHDWLYKNEMLQLEKDCKIELHTAFSRNPLPKQYVQDRMREDGKILADWIVKDKAYIYVCGDGNHMAKDVQEALLGILSGHVENPEAYLDAMKEQNTFVMDIWTS